MTASIAPSGAGCATGPSVYRFGSAEVRACARHLAIVVAVRGKVSAANLEQLTARVRRFVLSDTSFVLDLSEVQSLTPAATALLRAVDEACALVSVEWALVTGPATDMLFDAEIRSRLLPVVDSVADALRDFADARTAQRTLLLPLLQRSA